MKIILIIGGESLYATLNAAEFDTLDRILSSAQRHTTEWYDNQEYHVVEPLSFDWKRANMPESSLITRAEAKSIKAAAQQRERADLVAAILAGNSDREDDLISQCYYAEEGGISYAERKLLERTEHYCSKSKVIFTAPGLRVVVEQDGTMVVSRVGEA